MIERERERVRVKMNINSIHERRARICSYTGWNSSLLLLLLLLRLFVKRVRWSSRTHRHYRHHPSHSATLGPITEKRNALKMAAKMKENYCPDTIFTKLPDQLWGKSISLTLDISSRSPFSSLLLFLFSFYLQRVVVIWNKTKNCSPFWPSLIVRQTITDNKHYQFNVLMVISWAECFIIQAHRQKCFTNPFIWMIVFSSWCARLAAPNLPYHSLCMDEKPRGLAWRAQVGAGAGARGREREQARLIAKSTDPGKVQSTEKSEIRPLVYQCLQQH